MRSTLFSAAITGLLLTALACAAFAVKPAAGQSPPSLSNAISLTSGDVWSGDPSGVLAGPTLSEEYLQPVPANEDGSYGGDAGEEPCSTCGGGGGGGGGGGFYNRCGCDTPLFPWFTGPGNCDTWCVGPHWNVEADGMFLRRTGADWGAIQDAVGLAPDLIDNFGYGPGARIFVTGYNDSDFGMQVGYEGINDYHATALFPVPMSDDVRSFDYQSNFNSIEINVLRRTDQPIKFLAGFRYVELDEDFTDALTVGKSVPPPADPPGIDAFVDTSTAFLLENRLIGFQAGAFRDAWALNKWITIEPYGNAGVYYNNFKREELDTTTTTIVTGDDLTTPTVIEGSQVVTVNQFGVTRNFNQMSFLGEAGISSVLRVNRCVALRAGYQVMAIDGIGEGLDAFFNPGLNGSTVVYHGARFGFEYQR